VRDLVVHGSDLVAATYGRTFWILDDLTPLRQMNSNVAKASTFLYRPDKATRVRLDMNGDTPLPPEMPAGQNPPNGALIDYYLHSAPSKDITLAIYDPAGQLVREFSSKPEPPSTEPPPNVPDYWLARPEPLSKDAGAHRFIWDLHYTSPLALRHEYPISALYANTPGEPLGALALPGKYEVRLTVNGRTFTEPLEVGMDPRVDVTDAALKQEFELEMKVIGLVGVSYDFHHQAALLREAVAAAQKKLGDKDQASVTALQDFDKKAQQLQGAETFGGGGGPRGGRPKPTFALLNREFGSLATVVDGQDAAPTPAMQAAYEEYCKDLTTTATSWNELLKTDLASLNDQLTKQKLPPLAATPLAVQCK